MDDILKNLLGNSNGLNGINPSEIAKLIQGSGLNPNLIKNGGQLNQDEESLAEDEKMENIRIVYDLFIQNTLKHTSHTLEWLPIETPDEENSKFSFNYFLIGTHNDSSSNSNTIDYLQIVKVRIPNKRLYSYDIERYQSI